MNDVTQTTRLFELCDINGKGYLTKRDLMAACPQLSANEITFIFSCLDTNNSGTIEKSEFCAGFEETLCKGESRGFGGIQERVSHRAPSIDCPVGPSDNVPLTSASGSDAPSSANRRNNFQNRFNEEEVFMEVEEDEWYRQSGEDRGGGGGGAGIMSSHRSENLLNPEDSYGFFDSPSGLSPSTVSYLNSKSGQQSRSPKFLKKRPQPQFSIDIPCKDEVLQLYEELQSSGVPAIMNKFEEVVGNLCREIDQKREENEFLQNMQKTERDNYNKRMSEIENEMDQQLMLAEKKAREEERQRLTKEKQELKERLESEMCELQANIEHLQKMEKALKKESTKNGNTSEQQDALKVKLDEIARENRTLKNNLADNHLEMTLIKAELAELKSEYETRTGGVTALSADVGETAENVVAGIYEAENMQRQLQLLYDANKRLHDTNDNLRGALDQRTAVIRQLNLTKQAFPSLALSASSGALDGGSGGGSSPIPSSASAIVHQQHQLMSPAMAFVPLSGYSSFLTPDDDDRDSGFPNVRSGSSRTSISDGDLFRCASVDTNRESNYASSLVEFCGPPDRTFRVVMCGDSSVGKSSIIMRIVKGVYQKNISSTLGVDFHVKCIKMDKTNVAVQLWDTAGQERFRSLCNSYFRRADGAILVYDCSLERSFLRIRDWIETVKESVLKSIPILLVGNKVDLRRQYEDSLRAEEEQQEEIRRQQELMSQSNYGENLAEILDSNDRERQEKLMAQQRRQEQLALAAELKRQQQEAKAKKCGSNFVSQKEGENLSKLLETEFIECSALDGTNIDAALLLLVAEMMKQEDIQIKNTTVELTKTKKKQGCFSCRG